MRSETNPELPARPLDIVDSLAAKNKHDGAIAVWGDLRDFTKNGYRYAVGEEVDTISAILSSVGIATTLAPHVDVGLSVMKSLAKFMTAPVSICSNSPGTRNSSPP